MVTILLGASSSGKDAILRKLVSDYGYEPLISTTTRPIRDGEIDGKDYYFVSRDKFLSMIDNDELIEYRTYNTLVDNIPDTWYYGLSKRQLDTNKDYTVVLDVQGTKNFIDYYGIENCKIFEIWASNKLRTERAKKRGSFNQAEWDRRLETDDKDFGCDNMLSVLGEEILNKIETIINCKLIFEPLKYVDTNLDEIVERIAKWNIQILTNYMKLYQCLIKI